METTNSTGTELDNPYSVTDRQISSFQQNGHVMLPHVCSPEEIEVYRPILNAATARYNTETREMKDRDTYGKAFLQIMNLWVRDEAVRNYSLAKRFGKIAADLMGVDAVRLYHDQALYKEPGGGHTPWHQDQYYWPLETKGIETLTMWMPLVDVTLEMGALTFASGSHEDGFQGQIKISDESESHFENLVKLKGYPVTNCAMKAGDATFHSGWTLHCAPRNQSSTMREVMTIIFFADGVKAMEPDNNNRADDLAGWLPGIKPGELAASPINPVVFRRE